MTDKEKTGQEATLEELNAKVEALEAVVLEKDDQIAALQEAVAAKADAKPKKQTDENAPVVKLGKTSYKVLRGLIIGGQKLTREELAADKDLLAKLIEKGSNVIEEA